MNELIKTGAALTMSSREIAELVESRHDNVKTTIERLAARGVIKLPATQEVKNHLGQTVSEYHVGKRDSYVIVAQLSPEFTARLVDRWQELEDGTAALPKTLPEALRLAADLADKKARAEAALAIAAPKAEALDRIATYSDGSFCLRDAAKNLQIQEKKLIQVMQAKHWIYRRPMGSSWLAYADKLQDGYMEHKVTTGDKGDGTQWTHTQARVTAKGMARLAELLAKDAKAA